MREGSLVLGLVTIVVSTLLLSSSVQGTTSVSAPTEAGQGFSGSSWALGIVVPEGAGLQGGGRVWWEGVANVTAVMTLPTISLPDRVIYAVLSVMSRDGSVMQAAAGVYPNRSEWFTFSWFIARTQGGAPTYLWVLNSSEPRIDSGTPVSMSIFRESGVWNLKVLNEGTGSSVERSFPIGVASSLMGGDQEVFALESYSRLGTTFQGMGNLTLSELLLDGQKVTKGFYAYGDWNPEHNPLFVVGSSGINPPGFISLRQANDGTFVWAYEVGWGSVGIGDLGMAQAGLAIVLVLVLFVTAVVYLVVKNGRLTRQRAPDAGASPTLKLL